MILCLSEMRFLLGRNFYFHLLNLTMGGCGEAPGHPSWDSVPLMTVLWFVYRAAPLCRALGWAVDVRLPVFNLHNHFADVKAEGIELWGDLPIRRRSLKPVPFTARPCPSRTETQGPDPLPTRHQQLVLDHFLPLPGPDLDSCYFQSSACATCQVFIFPSKLAPGETPHSPQLLYALIWLVK